MSEPAFSERVEAWPGQDHRALALAALGFARAGDAQAAVGQVRALMFIERFAAEVDAKLDKLLA